VCCPAIAPSLNWLPSILPKHTWFSGHMCALFQSESCDITLLVRYVRSIPWYQMVRYPGTMVPWYLKYKQYPWYHGTSTMVRINGAYCTYTYTYSTRTIAIPYVRTVHVYVHVYHGIEYYHGRAPFIPHHQLPSPDQRHTHTASSDGPTPPGLRR
jgi:hypothetical protein